MADVFATSFGVLNYSGMLFNKGNTKTPLSSIIGSRAKLTNHVEFATGQEYTGGGTGSQPAISETASLTAPDATVVTREQKSNVTQIFQESVGISYAKQSNMGTLSIPFVIDAIAVFNTSLTTDLETASWALIDSLSQAGTASSVWSVGDTKTIQIGGVNYVAQIIGFNHDNKTAGGKAGITWQLKDCLNATAYMNSSNTNAGGWTSSAMRNSTMSSILDQLPAELQSVLKAVNKLSSAGNNTSTITTTSDKLFLLSEVEIFGSTSYSFAGEGSQYSFYAAGNSKVKKVNGSAYYWWERSPYGGGTTNFCIVGSSGSANDNGASYSFGVSFGFCV